MRLKTLALSTAAALAVIAGAHAADKVPARIGVTVGTLGNPFFKPLVQGAVDTVKKANPKAEVTVVGADYDLNRQSTQIDNFIASGVDMIFLNASDAEAIGPAVARAKAQNIIVAAFDVAAAGADVTVMTNNVQAGRIACDYLAKRLNGKGQVAIINGPPISSIIDRVKGCKAALADKPDIKIISDNQNGKASREGGFAIMQGLLTAFPHIDAVFGANDPTAIGAELAAQQQDRKEMIIAGVDGSPDMLARLKEPDSLLVASASQDPYGMAARSAEMALGLFQGKEEPREPVLLDATLVTRDNAATFKGWDAQR